MNIFKQWRARQKEQSKQQKVKDIRNSFSLRENGEVLCICHSCDIIHEYSPETTVREILRELNAKRDTAVKFAKI